MPTPQGYDASEIEDALREIYDSIPSEEQVKQWVNDAVADADVQTTLNQTVDGVDFVDRGDPSSADWTETDITQDGTWYELDLSSIVPSDATWVLLRVTHTGTANQDVSFRKDGNTNEINISRVSSDGASSLHQDCFVAVVNQTIEYRIHASIGTLGITVGGWFV